MIPLRLPPAPPRALRYLPFVGCFLPVARGGLPLCACHAIAAHTLPPYRYTGWNRLRFHLLPLHTYSRVVHTATLPLDLTRLGHLG